MRKDMMAFAAVPFVIAFIIVAPIIYFDMTAGAFEKVGQAFDEKQEEKMVKNPSEYVKENIQDIQFKLDKGFISNTKDVIVKTNTQTHIFKDYSINYSATKDDTSYLQLETRFPDSRDEQTIVTLFLSDEDLAIYSDAYAHEHGITLQLNQSDEISESSFLDTLTNY